MRTILACIILLAILFLSALYGASHAKHQPGQLSADYFQRVASSNPA